MSCVEGVTAGANSGSYQKLDLMDDAEITHTVKNTTGRNKNKQKVAFNLDLKSFGDMSIPQRGLSLLVFNSNQAKININNTQD